MVGISRILRFISIVIISLFICGMLNAQTHINFVEIAQQAGVADIGDGRRGAAWVDFDNDGDLDLHVSNRFEPDKLYQNIGNDRFVDIAPQLGLDVITNAQTAVTWADFDNDGDQDLYLITYQGPNLFFRNEGYSFTEITAQVGLDIGITPARSGAWADYDKDGLIDIYVVNDGGDVPDRLFHNDHGHRFTEVARGLMGNGAGASSTWGDFDNDGDLDLYRVRWPNYPNLLFRNDIENGFTEVASMLRIGNTGRNLGGAWGDYDNDGYLDLYVIRSLDSNLLYRNDREFFTEVGSSLYVNDSYHSHSAAWADYDNDGDIDLYVANCWGPDRLYRNIQEGKGFIDEAPAFGMDRHEDEHWEHGQCCVWGDYDNDGDLDLYVVKNDRLNRLYRNEGGNENNWLHLKLVGTDSNRDAIGTRVKLYAGDVMQIREVGGECTYNGMNSLTVEFGLGTTDIADSLFVYWPSGMIDRLAEVDSINQVITINEGDYVEKAEVLVPKSVK